MIDCKVCANLRRTEYGRLKYAESPESCKETWRLASKRKTATKNKDWSQQRRYSLKTRFGITEDDYDAVLSIQHGLCAICFSDDPGAKRNFFAIDHDHETGAIRGLLCNSCNIGLGCLQDSKPLLKSALKYLNDPPWDKLTQEVSPSCELS